MKLWERNKNHMWMHSDQICFIFKYDEIDGYSFTFVAKHLKNQSIIFLRQQKKHGIEAKKYTLKWISSRYDYTEKCYIANQQVTNS